MIQRLMNDLYGKDVIAYGTGSVGKAVIPYLLQIFGDRLRGVTNSKIISCYEGVFLETNLPIRSLQAWYSLFPNAIILVTALDALNEIYSNCKKAGFHEVEFITSELSEATKKRQEEIASSHVAENLLCSCLANELHDAHRASFAEFKACHKGKSVAIVGTGPSLNYYTQIEGIPHIGVNGSFLNENITLDYYFLRHYIHEWCEKLKYYNFVKFFAAVRNSNSSDKFPEYILEENGGRIFFNTQDMPGTKLRTNIEHYPLMAGHSIIFPALHFALYTRPKKIFLVGCDCSLSGHFNGTKNSSISDQVMVPLWISDYRELKRFAAIHYPDTELISVNPVGLKGMFHDVYTQSYLDAHPELADSGSQIISLKKCQICT